MRTERLHQVMGHLALGYEVLLGHFRRMQELAFRQLEVARSGDHRLLEKLLARRQALVEEIEAVREKLVELRAEAQQILQLEEFHLERVASFVGTPACERLRELLPQVAEAIAAIQAHDQEITLLLKEQLARVREALEEIRAARAAKRAYEGKPGAKGGLCDLTE